MQQSSETQGAGHAPATKFALDLTIPSCMQAIQRVKDSGKLELDFRVVGLAGSNAKVYPSGEIDFAIRVRIDGERPRLSLGKLSDTPLDKIRERHAQIRQLVAGGKDPRLYLSKRTTFSAFFEQHYRIYTQSHGKRSIASDESRYVHWLQPHFGTLSLTNITPLKIQGLITEMQSKALSNSTINNTGHLLNAVLNYAEHLNFLPVNFQRFKPLPVKKVAKPVMVLGDMQKFFAEASRCKDDEYAASRLMMLAMLTGARLGELLNLKHADIDQHTGVWRLAQQKSGKAGEIILSDASLDIIADMTRLRHNDFLFPGCKDNDQLSRPIKLFKRICKRAGISAAPGIHGLRHAYISAGVSANQSIEVLSQAARHSDVKVTRIYSHPYRSALRKTNEVIANQVIPHQFRRIRPQYGRFDPFLASLPQRKLLSQQKRPFAIVWHSISHG